MAYCNIFKEDVSDLTAVELKERCSHCLESGKDGHCPHLLVDSQDKVEEEDEKEEEEETKK